MEEKLGYSDLVISRKRLSHPFYLLTFYHMGVEHSPSSIAINHGSYIPGNPKVTNRINEILSPRVYEVRENDDWNKVSRGLSLSVSATNFLNINFGANKVTQMK